MVEGHSIVGTYYRLEPKERINFMYRNYSNFPAVMDKYESDLVDMIKDLLAAARRDALGDLGVRIQTGAMLKDPVGNIACEDDEIDRCLHDINYNGSIYEYINEPDEVLRGVVELGLMQWEYDKLCKGIKALQKKDYEVIFPFINQDCGLQELSVKLQYDPDTMKNKIYRIRKKLVTSISSSFIIYDDETILLRRCS